MTAPRLFEGSDVLNPPRHELPPLPTEVGKPAQTTLGFQPDRLLLQVYEHAADPTNPFELRDLYIGRAEAALGSRCIRPELAERWRTRRRRRDVDVEEVLHSRATIRFVKETFNFFFRDDLYGELRDPGHLVLSSGAVDEEAWGLPPTVKDCITYALARDWYGYSDSRGREPAREAIAAYEAARLPGAHYDLSNVALTMGGTFAVSCLADFVLGSRRAGTSLCAVPNYPPLVESVARRGSVALVPTPSTAGRTLLVPLIEALRPDTPLVLLQTAANPTGALVDEDDLASLIRTAAPTTTIVLDECHEWLGPQPVWSPARAAPNVVRVSSLSKNWSAPGLKIGWLIAATSFIDDYYEYASSTFGGPPSFFYTAVEVLARMERWRIEGVDTIGREHLAEFEESYGLALADLERAYGCYIDHRVAREHELVHLRDVSTRRLRASGSEVTSARYSINLALTVPGSEHSYVAFRELLCQDGVAVFPGLLTYCLDDSLVRITTARPWSILGPALDRIEAFSLRRQ